jgi:sialate O-acetylesterase
MGKTLLTTPLQPSATILSGITVPAWLSDGAVVPSGKALQISGTAAPDSKFVLEFHGQELPVHSDGIGSWKAVLKPPASGTRSDMIFKYGGGTKTVRDITAGELWLCAGQSNMQLPVVSCAEAGAAQADAAGKDIRFFNGKSWNRVTPENVARLSAVAFFFAADMAGVRRHPVGIYTATKGGTGIESWLPVKNFPKTGHGETSARLAGNPEVLAAEKADNDEATLRPYGQHRLARWGLGRAAPGSLFHSLVEPHSSLPISGVVWYQGETNADRLEDANEYDLWLGALISSWRGFFGNPRLPFVIIQLPEFVPESDEGKAGWTKIRETQAAIPEKIPHVATVDIRELGDPGDIHPTRKKEVGIRAARAAVSFREIQ